MVATGCNDNTLRLWNSFDLRSSATRFSRTQRSLDLRSVLTKRKSHSHGQLRPRRLAMGLAQSPYSWGLCRSRLWTGRELRRSAAIAAASTTRAFSKVRLQYFYDANACLFRNEHSPALVIVKHAWNRCFHFQDFHVEGFPASALSAALRIQRSAPQARAEPYDDALEQTLTPTRPMKSPALQSRRSRTRTRG